MTEPADPDLDRIFAALADGTRRHLLGQLLEGERTVGDLAKPLPMTLAAVSKHLQILMRAGLVSQLRHGRERACRLEPDGLAAALVWMQGFGSFDAHDMDALERMLGDLMDDETEEDDGTEPDDGTPDPGRPEQV